MITTDVRWPATTRIVAASRTLALATTISIAVLGGCATGGPSTAATPTPEASAVATFDGDGLVFEYPAAWRVFHYEMFSSFSHLIAYLGNVDVPEPCIKTSVAVGTRIDCANRYRLGPDSLVVTVQSNGMPVFDILDRPADAVAVTVGGLPGYREVTAPDPGDTTGAERIVTTTLAMPGSIDNYYTISAALHGPDFDRLGAQLDALVASLRYDPPVVPLPTDPGAATDAATKALAALARNQAGWGCFDPSGPRQALVSTLPMGPDLSHPQLASCSVAIEATPLQMWRMTLTLRLSEPDPQAGSGQAYTYTVWVLADGTPGETSGGATVP